MSLILCCIWACQIQFTKGLLLCLHVSSSSPAVELEANCMVQFSIVMHSCQSILKDKELAQGSNWWPLTLQTSSQSFG